MISSLVQDLMGCPPSPQTATRLQIISVADDSLHGFSRDILYSLPLLYSLAFVEGRELYQTFAGVIAGLAHAGLSGPRQWWLK